jgi:excisionase family DNA binding protein
MEVDDRLMTVEQAAEYYHVHPRTVRGWMAGGKLTALKMDPTKRKSPVRLRESEVKSLFQPRPEAVGQA